MYVHVRGSTHSAALSHLRRCVDRAHGTIGSPQCVRQVEAGESGDEEVKPPSGEVEAEAPSGWRGFSHLVGHTQWITAIVCGALREEK